MENNHLYLSKYGISMTLVTPALTVSTLWNIFLYSENPMMQESVDRLKLQEKTGEKRWLIQD